MSLPSDAAKLDVLETAKAICQSLFGTQDFTSLDFVLTEIPSDILGLEVTVGIATMRRKGGWTARACFPVPGPVLISRSSTQQSVTPAPSEEKPKHPLMLLGEKWGNNPKIQKFKKQQLRTSDRGKPSRTDR